MRATRAVLAADPGFEIRDEATMCEAAKRLHAELGCHAVLVKGGHLLALSPQQQQQQQQQQGGGGAVAGATVHVQAPALAAGGGGGAWPVVTDVLYDGRELHVLRAPAVACSNTHGTGAPLLDWDKGAPWLLRRAMRICLEVSLGPAPSTVRQAQGVLSLPWMAATSQHTPRRTWRNLEAVRRQAAQGAGKGSSQSALQLPWARFAALPRAGCTLASAVASFLARGQPLLPAVMSARAYLHECLRCDSDWSRSLPWTAWRCVATWPLATPA